MKIIQQYNSYQNLPTKQQKSVFLSSNQNIYLSKLSNNSNNISFSGISLRNISKYIVHRVSEASEYIDEIKNKIAININKSSEDLPPIEGSIDEIEKQAREKIQYIQNNYWFKSKKIKGVTQEEIEAKRKKLDEVVSSIQEKEATAEENLQLAESIPETTAIMDNKHRLERQNEEAELQALKSGYKGNVGFSRIAGYEQGQEILHKFFIDNIKLEKAGKNVEIPGSILFIGPTGNGKTTFAKAFAEKAGTFLVPIKPRLSKRNEQEFIATLEQEGEKAEERFKENRTRTILFVDEVTNAVDKTSSILKEFEDFLATCSKKYHCTVFSTTNHPSNIGINMDIAENFPIRVSMDPPNKENAAKIFEYYLKGKTIGEIDHSILADELIKRGDKTGGAYSNSQIKALSDNLQELKKNQITQFDILEYIRTSDMNPAINSKSLKEFNENVEKYLNDKI